MPRAKSPLTGIKIDVLVEVVLQKPHGLPNFLQMLMFKGLVNGYIVVAPAEMGGRRRFNTSSCRTRNGIDMNLRLQQTVCSKRQQSQLDASGKAARVCNVLSLTNTIHVHFRQTVNEIVIDPLFAIIGGEVYYFHFSWNFVPFQKFFAISVG